MSDVAFMVSLGDRTTAHRSFARAAQDLATTLGDDRTVECGAQIIEFSEDGGILLVQTWTAQMIDGEIAWSVASDSW